MIESIGVGDKFNGDRISTSSPPIPKSLSQNSRLFPFLFLLTVLFTVYFLLPTSYFLLLTSYLLPSSVIGHLTSVIQHRSSNLVTFQLYHFTTQFFK